MAVYDWAIVGGGIAGLGLAYAAARRGQRVVLLERGTTPEGASIRNFGMIWPIGQPHGRFRELALASRALWLQAAEEFGVEVEACGSLFLAHDADAWAVLQEYAARFSDEPGLRLLSAHEVLARSPAVEPSGLDGGLFSPMELRVDPPRAIATLLAGLAARPEIDFAAKATVVRVDEGHVTAADGRTWSAHRVAIASGADSAALFPKQHADLGLKRCKLQMLATVPQAPGWRLGPHLASGLSLRHYRAFETCPSLPQLSQRIATERPELDRFGIHVMASQGLDGRVILGDSHEYDGAIGPFDSHTIEQLMLSELRRVIRLPDWTIGTRWHGVYAKSPDQPFVVRQAAPQVWLVNGFGGNGMTLALAATDEFIDQILAGHSPGDERPTASRSTS